MEIKWEAPKLAKYMLGRRLLHSLLQLPDEASIFNLSYDYDTACVIVVIEHHKLQSSAEGMLVRSILPNLIPGCGCTPRLDWPDLEDKQT